MATADHLKAVVESFAALLEGHIKLFKLELAEDAKVIGVQVGKIAAFIPMLFFGYGFLCAALALFLMRYIAADLAVLSVGLLNLVVAGVGIALAARALGRRKPLEGTMREVASTTALISHAVRDPTVTVEVTNG